MCGRLRGALDERGTAQAIAADIFRIMHIMFMSEWAAGPVPMPATALNALALAGRIARGCLGRPGSATMSPSRIAPARRMDQ